MPGSSVTRLGELERAVMEHLWTHAESGGEPLTVRQVHETVGTQRDLASTTLMTVLDRLAKKALVTQERDGRAYRYSPVGTREELTALTMRETLGNLDAPDRKGAMLHFLDDASPQEIDDLKAALAQIEQRAATTSVSTNSADSTNITDSAATNSAVSSDSSDSSDSARHFHPIA